MRWLITLALGITVVSAACQGPSGVATTSTVTTTAVPTSATTTTVPATTVTTTSLPPDPVDLVFTGGPIITMDPDIGTVEAVAIDGDRIVAVGSAADIARYQGPDTEVIDLEGRAVQPGFVDPHTHVLTDMGGIEAGQPLALAAGMTSLGDGSVEPGVENDFVAAADAGVLRIRSTLYLTRTDVCGEDLGTWYETYEPGQELTERVRVGGIKIFSDGGACRALATSQPILDGYDSTDLYFDPATLTGMIRTADTSGYQVIVHAQGDLAIAEVEDAFAAVLGGRPNVLRHRIDHSAVQTDATIGRYGELGLIPVLFGPDAACTPDAGWTEFYKTHGDRPGDVIRANPGLVVAWHGDDPSLPPVSPIDDLWSFVTRGAIAEDGSRCGPADWMLDAEVERHEALAMMTVNAAYAIGQDDVVGSLTPGKYADLVVLSDDLLTVPDDAIPDVEVLATIIGGVTEYCLRGAEAWCPGLEPVVSPDVSASLSRAGHPPELVFDGVVDGESFWSSGDDAPQWIMVELPSPAAIAEVRFVVYQNPPSDTVHELEVQVDGEWSLVDTFRGFTATGDVLTWRPADPAEGISAFRMTTLGSLSWPEWYEIEIDTADG